MEIIQYNGKKCVACYSCVRKCPVKAITIEYECKYIHVNSPRCIGCGQCLKVCPTMALSFKTAAEAVKKLLASEYKVAAIVDPSISGEFPDITDYRLFVQMIRSLGFDYVMEVSFGADLVAREYQKLFSKFKGLYYFSTKCPSVSAYIEKYAPAMLPNLAPIVPPMIATAKVAHLFYGEDVKVVYIAPCLSAKHHIKRFEGDGKIEEVLTFKKLRDMFNEFNIRENLVAYSEFDAPLGYKGALFPLRTGLLAAGEINNSLLSGEIVASDGAENVIASVKNFFKHGKAIHRHFDLFFCHGCIAGPGMSSDGDKFLRHTLTVDYVTKRLKDFNKEEWEENIKKCRNLDLKCSFSNDDQRLPEPFEEDIQKVLKQVRENLEIDNQGCGACGFDTCVEFAKAVIQDLSRPDLCTHFAMKNQTVYIESLVEMNQRLTEAEQALKKSEQVALQKMEEAEDAREVFGITIQELPVGVVIVDSELNVIQSNKVFVDLLGEDAKMINDVIPGLQGADLKTLIPTNFYNLFNSVMKNNDIITGKDITINDHPYDVSVFPVRQSKVAGAVILDMRSPQMQRELIIRRVSQAIDENLSMVQQIGFLLGEGASSIEKNLNAIIENYKEN